MGTEIRKNRPFPTPAVTVGVTAKELRDLLLSLPDNERMFVITDPSSGEHRVMSIRRNQVGNIEYDYESVPE